MAVLQSLVDCKLLEQTTEGAVVRREREREEGRGREGGGREGGREGQGIKVQHQHCILKLYQKN